MRSGHRSIVVFAIAFAIGLTVVAAVALPGVLTSSSENGEGQAEATEAFIDAYRRSLEASYTVEGEFTRTMGDGRKLTSGLLIAQRPPDYVRRQLGGLSGAIDGRSLNCSTTPGGDFSCAPGAEAPPYDQDVQRRVEILTSYFDPASPPLYQVSATSSDCFRLDLMRQIPDPTYGDFTIMCFDAGTGAVSRFELHRGDGSVDLIEAVAIRQVTDLDFVITRNPTFDQRNDELQGARSTDTIGDNDQSSTTVATTVP